MRAIVKQEAAPGLVMADVPQPEVGINDVLIRESFLAATRDLTFAELEMDSLAKMELCIAIEVGTGVSLAPEELGRFAAIGEIVTMLRKRLHA